MCLALVLSCASSLAEEIFEDVTVNYQVTEQGTTRWKTTTGSFKLGTDGTGTLVYEVPGRAQPIVEKVPLTGKDTVLLKMVKAKPEETWGVNHRGVSPLMPGKFGNLVFTSVDSVKGPLVVGIDVNFVGTGHVERKTDAGQRLVPESRTATLRLGLRSDFAADAHPKPLDRKANVKGEYLWSIKASSPFAGTPTYAVKKIGETKKGNFLVVMIDQLQDVEAGLGGELQVFEVPPDVLDLPTNEKQIPDAIARLRAEAKEGKTKFQVADGDGNIVENHTVESEPNRRFREGLERLRRARLTVPDGTTPSALLADITPALVDHLAGPGGDVPFSVSVCNAVNGRVGSAPSAN